MVGLFSSGMVTMVLFAGAALGRMHWLERDGRHVFLHPRRFGQEQPAVIQKLSAACAGQICGTLAGQAVTPLLAAQPECSQQDMADAIIDASKQFDAATQANMITLAKEYRQTEKNTPPDFTTNPPRLRNSVFCQKAPKNPELNGLVQAQDPNNDPTLFFDPALGKTVIKGSQANTFPFGTKGSASGVSQPTSATTSKTATSTVAKATNNASSDDCPKPVTVTVVATATPSATVSKQCPVPVTVTVTSTSTSAASTSISTSSTAKNLQAFTGALGGVSPPAVVSLGNGNFQVIGNSQFNNFQNALVRSCDVQHNKCADEANATGNKGDLTVAACGTQQDACNAQARATAS